MIEDERRNPELANKIDAHIAEAKQFRCETKKALARLDTAMFADDENNEFKSVGVVTTIRRIDNHITVTCNIATKLMLVLKTLGLAFIGLGGMFSAGKVMGFW